MQELATLASIVAALGVGVINPGPSFVMVTSFGGACPDDRSLLLGSQRSQHSGWPRSGDQVELYSHKQWVDPPFCDGELAAAPVESVTTLGPAGVESVQP